MIPPDMLAAILERPGDDAPRLASADYLDENAGAVACPKCKGEGKVSGFSGRGGIRRLWECRPCRGAGSVPDGLADRADYIRRAVALARLGLPDGPCPADCPCGGEGDRLAEMVAANGDRWNPYFPGERRGMIGYTWRRGFVASARCTLADWRQHAPALLAAHPLGRAEVADVPGLVFEVRPPDRCIPARWSIVGDFRGEERYMDQYPDRPALVAGAAAAVAEIAARLEAAAGDRWPGRVADGDADHIAAHLAAAHETGVQAGLRLNAEMLRASGILREFAVRAAPAFAAAARTVREQTSPFIAAAAAVGRTLPPATPKAKRKPRKKRRR